MDDRVPTTQLKKCKNDGYFNWLAWWKVDKEAILHEAENYKSIKTYKSARGISFFCILFSIIISVGCILSGYFDKGTYWDAGFMFFLGIFIWFGHRWAILAIMLYWTVAKAIMITDYPEHFIGQLIWWTIYMHVFYMAFLVERMRNKIMKKTNDM